LLCSFLIKPKSIKEIWLKKALFLDSTWSQDSAGSSSRKYRQKNAEDSK